MPELSASVSEMMRPYAEILEEAWQQHLKPRESDAPTVISLFAGCGGSSLGYSMAGYRELLATEWDDNAVATFRLNFPEVAVHHGDIAALSVDAVLERTRFQPGELDVLDGSPPCQGFSTVGDRAFHDARNKLFREYARLLRGLRPAAFVMENVSGMVKGKMRLIFADCIRELKACGYRVSARLLDAMYFHVPQTRARIILIGIREDLDIEPTHPRAMAYPIAARDALSDIDVIREGWEPTDAHVLEIRNPDFENKWRPAKLPCCTIVRARAPMARFANGEHRELTAIECARLSSFPSEFVFIGSNAQRIERIGNSVPPLFMRAIANHIRSLLASVLI